MNRNLFRWVAPIIFILIVVCFYIAVLQSEALARSFLGSGITGKDGTLDIVSKFGDGAGFINALFSALAFGGVILTFYWQFMVDGKQQKATLQSQFENVFFNMTNTLESIIDGLSIKATTDAFIGDQIQQLYGDDNNQRGGVSIIKGRDVFELWFESFKKKAEEHSESDYIMLFRDMMKGNLDHYFRYLYRILVYIDQSDLVTEKEKYEYAAILRAQLSEYELLILFFNGLTDYGKQKAKPLFEKYSLFNNLRTDELINLGTIAQYKQLPDEPPSGAKYSPNAFAHSYSTGSHSLRFFVRLLFISVAIIAVYELISSLWDNYIIKLVLSKIPSNNIWIEILCALAPLYFYSHRFYAKQKFNSQQKQKRFGSILQVGQHNYLPFSVLLDKGFNSIAMSTFILLIYVTFFHKSPLSWYWSGTPIPYVVLLGSCLFADILNSALFVKWTGVNYETFLDWLSSVLVPGANSLQQWWSGLSRRYERIRGNDQASLTNVTSVDIPHSTTEQQTNPDASSTEVESNEEEAEPLVTDESQEPPATTSPIVEETTIEEDPSAEVEGNYREIEE